MANHASNPVLEALRTKIRTRMNDVTDNVATGSCKEFGDYRYMCGIIHGLAEAERDLLDMDKHIEES